MLQFFSLPPRHNVALGGAFFAFWGYTISILFQIQKEDNMERLRITEARLHAFARQLEEEERSRATVEKYMHSIRQFVQWLNG